MSARRSSTDDDWSAAEVRKTLCLDESRESKYSFILLFYEYELRFETPTTREAYCRARSARRPPKPTVPNVHPPSIYRVTPTSGSPGASLCLWYLASLR